MSSLLHCIDLHQSSLIISSTSLLLPNQRMIYYTTLFDGTSYHTWWQHHLKLPRNSTIYNINQLSSINYLLFYIYILSSNVLDTRYSFNFLVGLLEPSDLINSPSYAGICMLFVAEIKDCMPSFSCVACLVSCWSSFTVSIANYSIFP